MDPFKNLERDNAREWDDVSVVSSAAPSTGIPVPSAENSAENGNVLYYGGSPERDPVQSRVGDRAAPTQANRGIPQASTSAFVRSLPGGRYQTAPRGNLQTRYDPGQDRRPNHTPFVPRGWGRGRGGRGSQQENRPRPQIQTGPTWAEPKPLLTTRKAEALEEKRLREEEERQYRMAPNPKEDFPAIAYYLWPSNKPGQGPTDILGLSLETLDKIRVENKVFVWTSNDRTCLKICSRAPDESGYQLNVVIHAIRQVIRHQHALHYVAEPTLIAIPPTADAMTTLVLPIITPEEFKRPYSTVGVKLGGEKLPEKERLKWAKEHPQRLQACRQKFEQTLTKALNGLQTYRGWMRMRVRFGHVILHDPMNRFAKGRQWWEDFTKMMNSENMRSTLDAKFDNPHEVGALRGLILEMPERFRPSRGADRGLLLAEIPFKFMEVIFIDTPSHKLRIEAEIDALSESDREYQVGATRYFNDGERNKRLQMTVVDAEHQLDWAIDIVTDNEMNVDDIPMSIQQLVQGSVTTQSPIRRDSLELPYPGAKPASCIGATIKEIVVKSVVEYKLVNTDYVLELTLFRTWMGPDTTRDPVLSAAVAMYHNDWDDEMGRLTPTAGDRIWVRPLKTFFGKGVGYDETDIGTKGVERFIAEVEAIQSLLVDATVATDTITQEQKAAAEAEAEAQPSQESPEENAEADVVTRVMQESLEQADADAVAQAMHLSLEEQIEAELVAQALQKSLEDFETSDGADTVTEVARDVTDTRYGDDAAGDQHSRANSVDFPLLGLSLGLTTPTQNNADEVECVYGDLYSAD